MKAYVIKNKDGKYWSGYEWVGNLIFADMYTNKYDISNDETWQEITIEETNNQNQKAIECLKEVKGAIAILLYSHDISERETLFGFIDNKIKELEGK